MSDRRDRLGLRTVLLDQVDTWSLRTGPQRQQDLRRAWLWYYANPTAPALIFTAWHVPLQGVGQLISGATIFTALLFALLILVFNTGLAVRKDGAVLGSAHNLRRLVQDLRANITYAAFIAVALAAALVVAAATTPPSCPLPWGWTPPLVWLAVHLALNLLMILRRFRTAFNYISR